MFKDESPVILVADDDSMLRLLIRETLEKDGLRILDAEDGHHALATFQQYKPDIVLLDVMMPRMDGFSACAQLRRLRCGKHTPVMMMTSLNDVQSIHRAYQVGATDFITKPINYTILGYRIRYMLRTSKAEMALRNVHRELEQRVLERTAELLEANLQLRRQIEERTKTERELKRIHQELKVSESQLIQSAKLACIGELASGIAHELNQPLMVIRGCAQMLLQAHLEGTADHEPLKLIEQNTGRMNKIISHLRTFSRQPGAAFEPVDVNQIIHDVFLMVGEQLRVHDIGVRLDLSADLHNIRGDSNQIEQVLLNLITNARDAIDEKRSRELQSPGLLHIQSRPVKDGSEIEITVADNGTGIGAENLTRIFDPFFTTKQVGKGTGLGLSVSYGIIKEHQGDIQVAYTGPEGTKFRVTLPVHPAAKPEVHEGILQNGKNRQCTLHSVKQHEQ